MSFFAMILLILRASSRAGKLDWVQFGVYCVIMNKRILVVDDDPDFREIFSTHLRMKGYEADVADSADHGMEKIRAAAPDLVLMDVQMPPGKTGIEAFFELKNDPATKDVPIMFLTNLGATEVEAQQINDKYAQELGALGVLKKTDDLSSLSEKIAATFAGTQAPQ
jgi:CheY-like chemotaxis protein